MAEPIFPQESQALTVQAPVQPPPTRPARRAPKEAQKYSSHISGQTSETRTPSGIHGLRGPVRLGSAISGVTNESFFSDADTPDDEDELDAIVGTASGECDAVIKTPEEVPATPEEEERAPGEAEDDDEDPQFSQGPIWKPTSSLRSGGDRDASHRRVSWDPCALNSNDLEEERPTIRRFTGKDALERMKLHFDPPPRESMDGIRRSVLSGVRDREDVRRLSHMDYLRSLLIEEGLADGFNFDDSDLEKHEGEPDDLELDEEIHKLHSEVMMTTQLTKRVGSDCSSGNPCSTTTWSSMTSIANGSLQHRTSRTNSNPEGNGSRTSSRRQGSVAITEGPTSDNEDDSTVSSLCLGLLAPSSGGRAPQGAPGAGDTDNEAPGVRQEGNVDQDQDDPLLMAGAPARAILGARRSRSHSTNAGSNIAEDA